MYSKIMYSIEKSNCIFVLNSSLFFWAILTKIAVENGDGSPFFILFSGICHEVLLHKCLALSLPSNKVNYHSCFSLSFLKAIHGHVVKTIVEKIGWSRAHFPNFTMLVNKLITKRNHVTITVKNFVIILLFISIYSQYFN